MTAPVTLKGRICPGYDTVRNFLGDLKTIQTREELFGVNSRSMQEFTEAQKRNENRKNHESRPQQRPAPKPGITGPRP